MNRSTGDRVVIIGGGASGALSSVALAEAGYKVVALEKKAIGNGSSSRSAACIRAQFGVQETAIGMAYSEFFFSNFHEFMHTPSDQQCWMMKQNGYLFLYESPEFYNDPLKSKEAFHAWEEAQLHVEMQKNIGLPVEILKPAEVNARWPHLDEDRLIGATWCPTDGFLNHDQIYSLGFRRAKELGAQIYQNTEVIGARVLGGRIHAIKTALGEIECDWVVNAAGVWAPGVSQLLGGMDLRISPLKRYLWFLETHRPQVVSPLKWEELPMTIYGMADGRGAYSRPESEKSLMLGWAHKTSPYNDDLDSGQDIIEPEFRDIVIGERAVSLMEQIYDFSPILADCGWPKRITSGFYEVTPDSVPMIGKDDFIDNLIHSAGFSGHGLMHSPITSHIIKAIINGADKSVSLPSPFHEYSLSLEKFSPSRTIHEKEGMVI